MKMKRIERDMPKYMRAQRNYIEQFDNAYKKVSRGAAMATGMSTEDFAMMNEDEEVYKFKRESIEDMMSRPFDYKGEERFEKY